MTLQKKHIALLTLLIVGMLVAGDLYAQRQLRRHTANRAADVVRGLATQAPVAPSQVTITLEGDRRIIRSNSIAEHATGAFPNSGNPNMIAPQSFEVSLPLHPQLAGEPTFFALGTFGVAVNGVIIDPQAAEWYLGNRDGGWQYDPLGGAIGLGLDEHNAHVQPTGTYHYHGLPTGLLVTLGLDVNQTSPLVGWAMDGFPIFARYASIDGSVRELASSYRLKSGARPSGQDQPGGSYDGAFLEDWEYVENAGDLDACNGATVATQDFPTGTYAYFLTDTYPFIPRCFSGTPIAGALPAGIPRQTGSSAGDPLAQAAETLGIDPGTLRRAVGPPPPDFARAAKLLGIDEDTLRRAMRAARR